MTLGKAKEKLNQILDDNKPKADFSSKLNSFFDMGQKEIALYYPIFRTKKYKDGDIPTLPFDCFSAVQVFSDGAFTHFTVEDGAIIGATTPFTLRYKARVEDITQETPDSYELETQEEAIIALLYFVAAQSLTMEHDQRFFQSFYAQYQGKLQNLSADVKHAACVIKGDGLCSNL